MPIDRRQMLVSLLGGVAAQAARPLWNDPAAAALHHAGSLRSPHGGVDWGAVRELFPLAPDWTHLASFLFVSHPKPVAEAIERFRRQLDADPFWIEIAALTDAVGRPFTAVKRALAEYVGGSPQEICLTSNTTTALAMAYEGLRIRADQEIATWTACMGSAIRTSMSPAWGATSSPRGRTSGCSHPAARAFCGGGARSGPSCARRFRRSIRTGSPPGTPGWSAATCRRPSRRSCCRAGSSPMSTCSRSAAVELHRAIGRDRLAERIAELNAAFREGAARLPRVTLHTPRDAELSGGISCFEVAGLAPGWRRGS